MRNGLIFSAVFHVTAILSALTVPAVYLICGSGGCNDAMPSVIW